MEKLLDWTFFFSTITSLLVFVFNFDFSPADVKKERVQLKQKRLDQQRKSINFGPEEEELPLIDWETIGKRVTEGEKLVVVDGLVHDVASFIQEHPGGQKILLSRIGKDATIAFNGGVYRHSKAARNRAALMRVARLNPDQLLLRTKADDFVKEDE